MRRAVDRLADGAAAIGFALFAILLTGIGALALVGRNPLGLVVGGVGIAAATVAVETWTGRRFRWRPMALVVAFVVIYVVVTVIALLNMGP